MASEELNPFRTQLINDAGLKLGFRKLPKTYRPASRQFLAEKKWLGRKLKHSLASFGEQFKEWILDGDVRIPKLETSFSSLLEIIDQYTQFLPPRHGELENWLESKLEKFMKSSYSCIPDSSCNVAASVYCIVTLCLKYKTGEPFTDSCHDLLDEFTCPEEAIAIIEEFPNTVVFFGQNYSNCQLCQKPFSLVAELDHGSRTYCESCLIGDGTKRYLERMDFDVFEGLIRGAVDSNAYIRLLEDISIAIDMHGIASPLVGSLCFQLRDYVDESVVPLDWFAESLTLLGEPVIGVSLHKAITIGSYAEHGTWEYAEPRQQKFINPNVTTAEIVTFFEKCSVLLAESEPRIIEQIKSLVLPDELQDLPGRYPDVEEFFSKHKIEWRFRTTLDKQEKLNNKEKTLKNFEEAVELEVPRDAETTPTKYIPTKTQMEIVEIVGSSPYTVRNIEIHNARNTDSDIKGTNKEIKLLHIKGILCRPNGPRKGSALTKLGQTVYDDISLGRTPLRSFDSQKK